MSVPGPNSGPEKRLNGSDRRQKRKPGARAGTTNNNQPANNTAFGQNKPQTNTGSANGDGNRRSDRRRNRDDKRNTNSGQQKPVKTSDGFSSSEIAGTGPIVADPASLGYKKQTRTPRPKPKYLLPQQKVLTAPPFVQDKWDEDNQQKMLEMELKSNGQDYQGLYEELQAMREVERKHMEVAGLVDAENTRKDLNDAISFRGTCQDMCPVFERVRRALENNVQSLERDPATNKISRSRAVKAFSRPAAGQPPPLPSEVRPPQVLKRTLDYLVDEILPQLPAAHPFIWDRTRSIRQDFTYQNYFGPEAIDCNERIVRIHLVSLHIMAGSDMEYSQQQELEQFNKALQTLMEIYQDVRNQGGTAPNEAEFRAYYLLSHIRDPELDRELQRLPQELMKDSQIQLALMFRNIISQSNIVERGYKNSVGALNLYREFFRLVYNPQVPYLMSCLLETHFNTIRFYALKAISRAFHSKGKPCSVRLLSEVLGFHALERLEKFVQHFDIDVQEVDGERVLDLFNREKLELTYKLNSIHDKAKQPQAYSPQINSKLSGKLKDVINLGKPNDTLNLKNSTQQIIFKSKIPPPEAKPIPPLADPEPKAGSLADFLSKGGTNIDLNKSAFSFGSNSSTAAPIEVKKPFLFGASTNTEQKIVDPSLSNTNKAENEPQSVPPKPAETFFKPLEDQKLNFSFGLAPSETKAIPTFPKPSEKKPELSSGNTPNRVSPSKLIEDKLFADASRKVTDELIQKCIESELLASLPALVDRERHNRAREQIVSSLTKELYDAFLSEVVYQRILASKADEYYHSILRKKMLRRIVSKVHQISRELQRKRSRFLELNQSNFHKPTRKRTSANSSLQSISSSFVKRRTMESDRTVENIGERREVIKALWQPINWPEFARQCSSKLHLHAGPVSMKFLIVVKDWMSPYSKWLNTKLELGLNREKLVYEKEVKAKKFNLEVTSLPGNDYLTKSFFLNASFILFECGLVTSNQLDLYGMDITKKLEADALTLAKIIQLVDKHAYYKTQLLILYWDAGENGLTIESVETILQVSKWKQLTNISNIVVCDMTATDVDVNAALIRGFDTMAQNFDGTLTSRGIRKTAQAHNNRSVNLSAINDTFKEQEHSLIQSAHEAKKYDYLSNHLKKTNPGPVSASVNSSFAHDQTTLMNMSRLTGFGQGVMEESTPIGTPGRTFTKPSGRSLQQLRDLTASVRNKYKH